MPTFTSPLDLYRHQKAAFERTTASARASWRQIPEAAYRDFKELTAGNISASTLARMGHPYARIGGKARGASKGYVKAAGLKSARGAAPLLPINRQSGRLQKSVTLWHRSTAYTLEESVGFDAGKAGRSMFGALPKGTKYVVPRGIFVEIRRRAAARNRAYRDVFMRGQRAAFATV